MDSNRITFLFVLDADGKFIFMVGDFFSLCVLLEHGSWSLHAFCYSKQRLALFTFPFFTRSLKHSAKFIRIVTHWVSLPCFFHFCPVGLKFSKFFFFIIYHKHFNCFSDFATSSITWRRLTYILNSNFDSFP